MSILPLRRADILMLLTRLFAYFGGARCFLQCLTLFMIFIISDYSLAVTSFGTTSARQDKSCLFNRTGSANCTAGEFTVGATFSAAPGTPPFCMAGQSFEFVIDLSLTSSNADRYDVSMFVGQTGNDPRASSTNGCSVAILPKTPSFFFDQDGDQCGDLKKLNTDVQEIRIDKIKVACTADAATGSLTMPYVLAYNQNAGTINCGTNYEAAFDLVGNGSPSKCNYDAAGTVNGVVGVRAGAWFDITKETNPDGDSQVFNYTVTGTTSGSAPAPKVVALTGATLTNTTSSGGTYNPSIVSSATTTTSFSLSDGQTARVFIDLAGTDTRTITVVETNPDSNTWENTAQSITCTQVGGTPTLTSSTSTRTMSAALTAANYYGKCTITNKKRVKLQVTKVANGSGAGTFTFTGTNGWASQNISTVTAGVGVSGTKQTLTATSTATTITESDPLNAFRLTGISCTPSTGVTTDLSTRTVSLDATATAPGADIACTFTNLRQRTLTVTKSLSPVDASQKFIMTANGTAGTEGSNGATAIKLVDVGATVSFSEAAGTSTSLANYSTAYSCNTSPATTGTATSGSFTMPDADTSCTVTNTRKSATLVLKKTWVNAVVNDAVNFTATGLTTFPSTANSTSETDIAAGQTVYSGNTITLGETFTTGSSANYTSVLSCTGATNAISGNNLTIDPLDNGATITCTQTNTRKSATLVLQKTWVGAKLNDAVNFTATGLTTHASTANTVNETDTAAGQTVYSGNAITLAESFTTGSSADYISSLSCSGNTVALSGNVLTIDPADNGATITCTQTNTRKSASLVLEKIWVNGKVNDAVDFTATGLTTFSSLANTANETDTSAGQTAYTGSSITLSESFTTGSALNYNSVLSCSGNATALAGNVLTIGNADHGNTITCTQTNTRKTATLTLVKTWVDAKVNDAVDFTATGLTTFSSTANSASETDAAAGQTVRAGDAITLSESFTTGNASNYTSVLSCSGNVTPLSGNVLTVNGVDTAITCTQTNTHKTATLTLVKTWVGAKVNDAVDFTATSLTTFASTANSASETDTAAGQTVRAGDAITLTESFTTGSALNYTSVLSCSGNATPLSGNVLTVNGADTAITCTQTNTRKTASLTLVKAWSGAVNGDTATVVTSGFENNASSGDSVSTGNNTTTGTSVTVYAAESGTISETFSVGSASNYSASISCAGTSGLSGSTLLVAPADTVIVCTMTNAKLMPVLSLLKLASVISDPVNGVTNAKSIPGAISSYTLKLTNSGSGTVDNNSLVISDPLPSLVELYVDDLGGVGNGPVLFVDGTPVSGLSWTFTDLSSLTDSIDFSSDGGATWTYVPVPDANGFDAAVTNIRLRPQGVMNASGGGDPYIDMTFRVRIK